MDATQLENYYFGQLEDLIYTLERTNWRGLEAYLKAQGTYTDPWVKLDDFIALKQIVFKIID